MSHRIRILRLTTSVFAALLLLTPSHAFASFWGRGASARNDAGTRLSCDGGYALAWVYGTEPWFDVDARKVNSLYAVNIYGDSVEVLISWPKTPPASPQCYVVQTGDSVPYGYRERPLDVYPTPGTWISLKVQRWTTQNPDSFDWAYYVNTTSTPKGVLYNTGMRSAMIAYGEERQALLTDDSGQLSFKSLSYLPFRGTAWYYVPNVLQDNDYLQNNDPYYHWDFSQIDSTYHKIMGARKVSGGGDPSMVLK